MSEPQDVLQALREALTGKEDKGDVKLSEDAKKAGSSKPEEEDVGPQKVKSKNAS